METTQTPAPWEHSITSFGGQTLVLQFSLHPADTPGNWQDLNYLT